MLLRPKEGNPGGHAEWAFQVVHRDIKPGNSQSRGPLFVLSAFNDLSIVFLGKEDPDNMPYFPVPKLGDFGLAVTTYKGDHLNPRYYRDAGTPRYYAPVCSPTLAKRLNKLH